MWAEGLFADQENVAPDIAEIERIERQYFRLDFESCKNRGEVFGRSRTDMAQILGDDEVGRQSAQNFGVDRINALAARAEFAHQAVDLGGCSAFRNAGMNDNGFRARGGRKIALVTDAKDFPVQSESEENLRGGREQRNNAQGGHSRTLPQPIAASYFELFIEEIATALIVVVGKTGLPTGNDVRRQSAV